MVMIDANTIIKLAEFLTALAVVGGVVLWCVRFVHRNKKQDEELDCDGPVTEALDKLEKHLNKAAHDEESPV